MINETRKFVVSVGDGSYPTDVEICDGFVLIGDSEDKVHVPNCNVDELIEVLNKAGSMNKP